MRLQEWEWWFAHVEHCWSSWSKGAIVSMAGACCVCVQHGESVSFPPSFVTCSFVVVVDFFKA